jgi:hypothetical protein
MSRTATLWGFAALAAAAAAYQVAGLVVGRTATLGQAVRRLTRFPAGRYLMLACWLWAGWHVLVRRS